MPAATPAPTPGPRTEFAVADTEPTPIGIAWSSIATPTPTPSAEPTNLPTTAAAVGGTGPGGTMPAGADVTTGPSGGASGDARGRWGPVASVLAIAGLQGPTFPGFGLFPTLVTTTGVVAVAMGLSLFGRRRRDDDPPDDVLAAAAAVGVAAFGPDGSGLAALGLSDIMDSEALMPRWRRPSLLQARKADPIRDNTPAPRLTFDEGLVGPIAGRERRTIRYRVVRLLDSPTNCVASRSAASTRATRSSSSRSTAPTVS